MSVKIITVQKNKDRVIIEKMKKLRANLKKAVQMRAESWRQKCAIRIDSYVEGLRDALGNKKVNLLVSKSLGED